MSVEQLSPEVGEIFDHRFSDAADQLLSFGEQHRNQPEDVAEELNNFQAAQEWLDHQARVLAERVPHEGEQDTSLSPEEISWRQTALGESMLSYLKAMKMSDFVRIALETLGIHEWSELQAVGQEFESQEDELEQEIDKSLEKARDAYKKIQQALKSMEQLLGANNNSADEEYL